MFRAWLIIAVIFSHVGFGNTFIDRPKAKLEVGLSALNIIPNNNLELESPFSAYGFRIHVPVGRFHLPISGVFGKQELLSGQITEYFALDTGIGITLWTPFFSGFLQSGVSFSTYRRLFRSRINLVNPFVGAGFGFQISENFSLKLDMKVLLREISMVQFGAHFMASI